MKTTASLCKNKYIICLNSLVIVLNTLFTLACVSSEKSGSCAGNLQLSGPVIAQSEGVFLHCFHRSHVASQQGLTNSSLSSRDRIVVSDLEGRLVGLATGYLCEVSQTAISCTLDRLGIKGQ